MQCKVDKELISYYQENSWKHLHLTDEEAGKCLDSIIKKINSDPDTYDYTCDSFRAIRLPKKKKSKKMTRSEIREYNDIMKAFKSLQTCCGCEEWSEKINGVDYLLGFNYGH